MMREKTIKVSEEEYQRITEARNVLAQRGYSNLPDNLPLSEEQKRVEFTQGAIVGLGLVALIYLLTRDE